MRSPTISRAHSQCFSSRDIHCHSPALRLQEAGVPWKGHAWAPVSAALPELQHQLSAMGVSHCDSVLWRLLKSTSGWLAQVREMCCLRVSGARNPGQVLAELAPSEDSEEEYAPGPSSSFGWFFGIWCFLASAALPQPLPSSCVVFSLCVSLCPISPFFYEDTNHIGLGSSLLQDDSILTNYSCKDPISK